MKTIPSVVRQLERLRVAYGLNKTDMGRLAKPKRNRASASVYWLDIHRGESRIYLNDAETLARELGGRLRVVHRDPWADVRVAIEGIPQDEIEELVRDDLLVLLERAYWRKHPEGHIPRDLQMRPSKRVLQLISKSSD